MTEYLDFYELKSEIATQIESLKEYAMQFQNINITENGTCNIWIDILLDSEFKAHIGFEFIEFKTKFDIKYYLEFEQLIEGEGDEYWRSIVPKKQFMPKEILALGKYKDSRYNIEQGSTISEAGINAINKVLKHRQQLLEMCIASTCWNSDGSLKYNLKDWKTDAQLIKITKEMPVAHLTTGIKKDNQSIYDGAYGIHGSNGTYVENVNPEWILEFRVKKLGIEVDGSEKRCVNIHDYIRHKLMPRLEWGKITEQRLDLLNNKIHGQKLKVLTYDMDKAPIYREFKPLEYKDWDEALDHFLEGL